MIGMLVIASPRAFAVAYIPATGQPPNPPREFRGVWVASVYNIDWPSSPGLSVSEQKRELLKLLDRAADLRLNAVLLQVRPACDALYASPYEPWSYYLTGTMGRSPDPFYDPLKFAVEEAHKRGLELHAWFNPFRAKAGDDYSACPRHITRERPDLVVSYGTVKWLDPGEPEARALARKVILDVVRRYDVDGVHLDDYFYPYPILTRSGRKVDFPDDKSWWKYGSASGMSRSAWRQANINSFVHDLYSSIKTAKPWVKFGISPFGIWKSGMPEHTMAYIDSRDDIHADSRLWLQKGWVDYFSPQLYWEIESPKQSFTRLLGWWRQQNVLGRNLWPGLAIDRVGPDRKPQEIINEIRLTRNNSESSGHIHWSMKELMRNRRTVSDMLKDQLFTSEVLIPAYPWLGKEPMATPALDVHEREGSLKLAWALPKGGRQPAHWVLQDYTRQAWRTEILAGSKRGAELVLSNGYPDAIYIRPADRNGNLGPVVGLKAVKQVAER
ncbi:MAG: family 10 glycosylhydrolase [Methylacidiphilales bacterium]|nr:family 10 glycosylhydrolase [Candidatus Methylacidiphilales bacterium]